VSTRNAVALLIGAAGLMLAIATLLFGPVIAFAGSDLANTIFGASVGVLLIALAGALALKAG
jgi:hypothetical protein